MDDEQAIRALIATWLSASKAGDTETVLGLMSDDVVFLVCGRPPMRGKEEFAASQTALKDVEMDGTSEIRKLKCLVTGPMSGHTCLWTSNPGAVGPSTNAPATHFQSCEKAKANGCSFVTPTCWRPSLRSFSV